MATASSDLYKGSESASEENKIMFIPKNMKKVIHEISEKKWDSQKIGRKLSKAHVSKDVPISVFRMHGQGVAKKNDLPLNVANSVSPEMTTEMKITVPMQDAPQEKKSVDYLRTPSAEEKTSKEARGASDKEINRLLEQLRQVGQDQNEHY